MSLKGAWLIKVPGWILAGMVSLHLLGLNSLMDHWSHSSFTSSQPCELCFECQQQPEPASAPSEAHEEQAQLGKTLGQPFHGSTSYLSHHFIDAQTGHLVWSLGVDLPPPQLTL